MEDEKLKAAAETVTMPDEMKRRIVRSCKTQISNTGKETVMKTNRKNTFLGRPAAAAAALVICLSLSVTALAAPGILTGYFQDITNWQGAVVGTSYEQASDEIDMNVTVNGSELTVLATFADPQAFPYREAEKLGIAAYRIVDASGNTVKEGTAEPAEIVNGCAAVSIQLDELGSGSYKLAITAFVAGKKADQPLKISGSWESAFTK